MFDALATEIDRLDMPAESDAVRELLRLRDRLTAKAVAALGAFDAARSWALVGDTSLTAWLRHHAGAGSREASHLTRTAKALRALPRTAGAYVDGRLTTGQVDGIVANLTERTTPVFAEHEADLVPVLEAEAVLDVEEPPEAVRELYLTPSLDGRLHGSMTFDAEAGAVVRRALRLAETKDVDGEPPRTAARRRADAMVDVCRFYLDHQRSAAGGRHRPHVNVVVTLDELEQRRGGHLADGTVLPRSTVEVLLCDCALHRVITDAAGTILDYGRATRTAPANLFNALVVRDRHCRHPGCDRGPAWCDAHHVRPWELGGATSLDNLVLKCSRHHHLGHQAGWSDELLADGTYVVTDPSGRTERSRPPGALPLATAA